jgi:AcrR family transcriptional regulator
MTDPPGSELERLDEGQKRPVGRPRPAATDPLILRATIDLLVEGGPSAATIDAIAARSGCAKTTIYRRWPTRDELILDALRTAVHGDSEGLEALAGVGRQAGSAARAAGRAVLALVRNRVFRAAFPTLAQELLGDTPLGERFRREVFHPIRALTRGRLERDGALGAGVDPDLVLDLINGAVMYRALVGEPLSDEIVDALADLVLQGARNRAEADPAGGER